MNGIIDTVMIGDKMYNIVESTALNGCDGCALVTEGCFFLDRPFCTSPQRHDNREVIFMAVVPIKQ